MAEGYQTDEQQIEELRKWWAENGKSIIIAIVVAVAGVFGWQGYQKKQQAEQAEASAVYQNMLTAAHGANGQPTPEQLTTAKHLADTLKQEHPDSTFAQFAALYKAQFAVGDKDLDAAAKELNWVLDRAELPEIKIQARLRLARVLAAGGKYDEALAQLQGDNESYAASYEEARGDIYRARGDNEKALTAYQSAMDINSKADEPVHNRLLEIKLEQTRSSLGVDATKDA